jgi:hypothetical protein
VDGWKESSEPNFLSNGSERVLVRGERTDDPQTMRGGSTGSYALTPAQGLERGRDGGEVKVMTVIRA